MRPVSAQFLAGLRGSHRMVARARICAPGQTGTNPVGVEIPIIDGDVKFDSTADVRANLAMTTQGVWPILTGQTFIPAPTARATAFDTGAAADIMVTPDGDAADILVDARVRLFNSLGAPKESTTFTVIAKASAFGFTNIQYTPASQAVTVAGDQMRLAVDVPVSQLLTPYGNEVFVERGMVYGDGVREWVSQGYFRLYEVDQDEAPDGTIALAGRDRMSAVVDADVLAPFQFSGDTPVSVIFDNLIGELYPDVPIVYDFDADTASFSSSHIVEDSRYEFLLDVVQSLGKIMYFAYDGTLQVRDAPSPDVSVFSVNHGGRGVTVSASRGLSREGIYNAVVATGEQPGEEPPVRGFALDLDPKSPTYWHGSFGKVPRFYSSSFLQTEQQCTGAAAAMLTRVKGRPYKVDFSMVPNPALEALDAVAVSYTNRDAPEVHVIDTLTVPLTPEGVMTSTTRLQTLGAT